MSASSPTAPASPGACASGTRSSTRISPLAEPTRFHLVRHAAHGLLPHTLAGRMPGVPLSNAGRAQAACLAARIDALELSLDPCRSEKALHAVVSSPVQRALETADALAAPHGVQVQVDPGFEEIDFGAWTGQSFDALADDPDWHRWNRIRSLARCPGGETMLQAQARATAALARLHAALPGSAVAVVSHADVIKSILAAALGLSLDHLHRLAIDPASISTILVFDDGIRVDRVNL